MTVLSKAWQEICVWVSSSKTSFDINKNFSNLQLDKINLGLAAIAGKLGSVIPFDDEDERYAPESSEVLFRAVDGTSDVRLGSPVFTDGEIRGVEGFVAVEECSGASTSLVEVAISAAAIDVFDFVEETKEQPVVFQVEIMREESSPENDIVIHPSYSIFTITY